MKWLALCLLAGVIVGLASACGGDDSSESSVEEYFGEFEMIEKRADQRSDEIERKFDEALGDLGSGSFDERRDRLEELFDETLEVFDDYLTEARDLNPPNEVWELHERYVAAVDAVREALSASAGALGEADSLQDVIGVYAGLEAPAGHAREVCEDLEDAAGDRGIEVDLECGSD